MLEYLFDTNGVPTTTAIVGAAVILLLVVLIIWAIRRRGPITFLRGGHGRQPRLAVLDATPVDSRRRLVLVRRDNIEHLIMIGGPSDIVIESRIVRSDTARLAKPAQPATAYPGTTTDTTEDKKAPPPLPEPVPMSTPTASRTVEKSKVQSTVPEEAVKPTSPNVRNTGQAFAGPSLRPNYIETPKPAAVPPDGVGATVRTPTDRYRGRSAENARLSEVATDIGQRPAQQANTPKGKAEPVAAIAASAVTVAPPADKENASDASEQSGDADTVEDRTLETAANDTTSANNSPQTRETPDLELSRSDGTAMPVPAVEPPEAVPQKQEPPLVSKAQELIGEFDQLLESELNKNVPNDVDQNENSAETKGPDIDDGPEVAAIAPSKPAKQASLEDEMKKLLGDLSTRR